jgi:hypothetical protein
MFMLEPQLNGQTLEKLLPYRVCTYCYTSKVARVHKLVKLDSCIARTDMQRAEAYDAIRYDAEHEC